LLEVALTAPKAPSPTVIAAMPTAIDCLIFRENIEPPWTVVIVDSTVRRGDKSPL
jgi:hypothetical protein